MITLDTPLKFTAPGGKPYAGGADFAWSLPDVGKPGEWAKQYKSTPILCERGYHWCEARHALEHVNVELWLFEPAGMTVRGDDKSVSQGGRLLSRVETWNDRTARLFAADCAESVVHLAGDAEAVCWATIDVVRRFAWGNATQDEISAASAAARDAAWASDSAAASTAASAAAWAAASTAASAAAWAAASTAASTAASAVARGAAWASDSTAASTAASAAAWAAASAAARDAAWASDSDAAWAAQTTRLLHYLNGEVA